MKSPGYQSSLVRTVEQIRSFLGGVAEEAEDVHEVVVLAVDVSADAEGVLVAFGKRELDDVRKRAKIADDLHEDDVHELRVDLLSLLVPLLHVQDEALRDRVVVDVRTVVDVINGGTLDLGGEACISVKEGRYGGPSERLGLQTTRSPRGWQN